MSTFYTGPVISGFGSDFTGLTNATNVVINPATEDGNLASILARLDVNLSTVATQVTLAALNTKVTTTANGIKVDGSAVTQPVSGTVTSNIQSSSGGTLTATGTSLNVNVTGGSTAGEEHTVDSAGDLYTAGTTKGVLADARVVAAAPVLTAGQFSALTLSTAGRLITDSSGVTQPISATSLPLPTGAATEATLLLVNTNLDQLTYSATRLLVDGSGVTQPVSGTVTANIGTSGSLALEATLLAMSAKLPAALGQLTMAASMSVAIASNQSTLPTNNSQWGGVATSLGQKVMASSVPVTLSSDQSALQVSQSGTWDINNVSGTISLPTGASTEATLLAAKVDLDKFTFTSTRLLVDGSGVTQPVSAASLPLPAGASTSALQSAGNLSLSSIDGKLPTTLGQKTSAASLAVVLASDQSSVAVTGPLTDTQLRAVAVPVSGTVNARLLDGSGTLITSTGGALNVSIATPLSVDITGDVEDLNTGAGVDNHEVFAIGLPGATGHVVGGTATNPLRVDPTGTTTQPVSISSMPLPTGAATEATLLLVNTNLDQLTYASTRLLVDGSGVTQPVSAASLPLPTGAATSALQTTGNSSLSSIDGKIPALGQALMAASLPVTLASNQSALAVTGPLTDTQLRATAVPVSGTVAATQSGTWNINNISGTVSLPTGAATETTLAAVNTNLDQLTYNTTMLLVDGSGVTQPISASALPLPTGAATEATLLLANANLDQFTYVATRLLVDGSGVTQPVSAVSLPLPTGAATETTLAAVNTNLDQLTYNTTMLLVDGSGVTQPISAASLPLPTGASTEATLLLVNANLDQLTYNTTMLTVDGSGVTQPVSAVSLPLPTGAATSALQTTGNSSLSSIDGKLPVLGQALMAASIPVTLASNQSALAVTGPLTDAQLRATAVPVSGTVTANIGTTNGLALDTTLAKLTIANTGVALGTNTQALVGGSVTTAAPTYTTGEIHPFSLTTSGELRTTATLSASTVTVTQATGTNLHAVIDSGTVTANAGTGSFTVAQATGTNLHTVVDSGTLTANIGTTGGLALDTSIAKLNVSQAAALGSNTGPMMQGSVTTAAPSYTSGNINPLSLTPSGALRVDATSTVQPVSMAVSSEITYAATVTALAPGAAATDVITITGSASKTVYITRINFEYETTATEIVTMRLIKRSTANSGGTSSAVAAVSYDSDNPAASATVLAYTANPTLGTTVGVIENRRIFTMDATPSSGNTIYSGAELYSAGRPAQAIVLRGTSQVLSINLNGVVAGGASLFAQIEWTEA